MDATSCEWLAIWRSTSRILLTSVQRRAHPPIGKINVQIKRKLIALNMYKREEYPCIHLTLNNPHKLVGIIALFTLLGLAAFTLFFLAATLNTIVISSLAPLAAGGGFLASFLKCLADIYILSISVAAFIISAITVSAIVAALITTGWIGFIYNLWLATKKGVSLAKRAVLITESALYAYISSHNAHQVSDIASN